MIKLSELVSGLASGGDDAPRWMAAVAKLPNNAVAEIDPLPYQFQSPCIISQRKGVRLTSGCNPIPDGDTGCPQIHWAGSTGEYVFHLDRCYGVGLEGLSVEIDASGTAYRGVNFDDDGPGMSSQNFLKDFRIHALHDNENYVMISIAEKSGSNHEYYRFENIQLSGGYGANGPGDGLSKGVGFKIGNSAGQSKRHRIRHASLTQLGTAIWQVSGSFNAEDISCTNNECDIRRDDATEPSTVHLNTERSRRALDDMAGQPFTFAPGSRFGPQWARNGYMTPSSSFTMQGTSVDDHTAKGIKFFDFSRKANLVILAGNTFAPGTGYDLKDDTKDELGINTMPLDRPIMLINNGNIGGAPAAFWVRGGTSRVELGAHGEGHFELCQAIGHALSGHPIFGGHISHLNG